jgi:5-methylcytosine-specific restriction endonuclease McrA
VDLEGKGLEELFELANKLGNNRYHRLTSQDLENYKKFDNWRYINGEIKCGTTKESQDWAKENSDWNCPICGDKFSECGGRTIDHKLPRSRYPWLSMDFRNFWVICKACNDEKGEMHWYEYEHYMFVRHSNLWSVIRDARPNQLLKSLKE